MVPIHETGPLPRPTLVVFDHNLDPPGIQRLRDVMTRFAGHAHPQFPAFRPAIPERYEKLLWHMQRKVQRLPPLLELSKDEAPLRLPLPATSLSVPPLSTYAVP
jgi:hypothetical protein